MHRSEQPRGDIPALLGLRLGAPDSGVAWQKRRARDWTQLLDDLGTLSEEMLDLVDSLDDSDGERATPCRGWALGALVTHLALGDQDAVRAMRGERWTETVTDADAEIDRRVQRHGHLSMREAAERLQQARTALIHGFRDLDPAERFTPVEWAVQPISRIALAQSRVMETWIHGWDCSVALSNRHLLDDRAYWVSDLGRRSLPYAVERAGLPSTASVTASLDGPAGGQWERKVGTGSDPVTVRGHGWAWVALCSRRIGPGPLEPFLRLTGSAHARAQLAAARAFL